ncbi:hypothetical protein GKQ77_13795 [Streptomyces sp. BG9H]|uniref:Uncharacterized protein n=1 Tax=Streptomyces anatolicus TaxID=2675858 RepID=A0ABS6YPZ2_9ACTN|nr:hypothetical protein [Streptomyces anatolicus]MBW5422622.1 hypothetical protein [Streptomyces anatolicus]
MAPADTKNAFGYTLVIPPGWTRVPLREGTQDAIKKIVDEAAERVARELPKDQVAEARMELYRRLNSSVKEARQRDGVDLYLPTEPMHGYLVAASIIVAKVDTALRDGVARQDVMIQLITESDDAEPTEVDGAPGMRKERTMPAAPEKGAEAPSKHVDYVVQVPSSDGDAGWVVVSFSTVGDGDPESDFTEILVELFDAVMTTFRWRTE